MDLWAAWYKVVGSAARLWKKNKIVLIYQDVRKQTFPVWNFFRSEEKPKRSAPKRSAHVGPIFRAYFTILELWHILESLLKNF